MSDLIDRDAALNCFHSWADKYGDVHTPDEMPEYQALEELPSIEQPEIIRCRDCKYWMPYDWMFSEVWKSKNMEDYLENEIGCVYADMSMSATDFCSRAERREDDHEAD